mmetsp:Transcript_59764/g.142198  ORF Transcript_59764/g.142198 Transcript_59764/m.142198 type:complete len:1007 (-) Transcript_59764:143-3163(-)
MLVRDTPSVVTSKQRTQLQPPVPLFANYDPVDVEWVVEGSSTALLDVASCYLQPQTRTFRRQAKKGKPVDHDPCNCGQIATLPREMQPAAATNEAALTLPPLRPRSRDAGCDSEIDLAEIARLHEAHAGVDSVSLQSGEHDREVLSSAFTVCTEATDSELLCEGADESEDNFKELLGRTSQPLPGKYSGRWHPTLKGRRRRPARRTYQEELATVRPAIMNAINLPHMESICRASVQAAFVSLGSAESSHTWRRMRADRHARFSSRRRAAHWRAAKAERERLEMERLQAQQALEDEQSLEEIAEEEALNAQSKVVKWDRILDRLEARGRKESMQMDDLASPTPSDLVLEAAMNVAVSAPSPPQSPGLPAGGQRSRIHTVVPPPPLSKKSKADMRIEGARRARREMQRLEQLAKQHAAHVAEFANLPEAEQSVFREVFDRNTLLDCEGYADVKGLTDALAECGINGSSFEDRSTLTQLCEQLIQGKRRHRGAWICDVYEFAVRIAPAARNWLHQERRTQLTEALQKCNTNWEGRLDYEQACEAVRNLMPFDAKPVFEQSQSIQEAWTHAMQVVRQVTAKHVIAEVDVEQLLQVAEREIEAIHISYSAEQLKIKSKYKLDAHTFREFRPELIFMDNLFKSVDADRSGAIDRVESVQLCSELGLLPRGAKDWASQIASLMDVDEQLDFAHFLDVVVEIRQRVERHLESRLNTVARHYQIRGSVKRRSSIVDTDGKERRTVIAAVRLPSKGLMQREPSGELRVAKEDLPSLLEEMNIVPQTPSEQHALDTLLQDYSGEALGFDVILRLCARAQEAILTQKARAELDLAKSLGFSPSDLGRLRMLFSQVDIDACGKMLLHAAHKAFTMLGLGQIEFATLKLAFNIVDIENRGFIDVQDFIRLVKMARDGDGPFRVLPVQAWTLADIPKEDLQLVLCCFGVPWLESAAMTETVLLRKAAGFLGVAASDILSERLNLKTLPELYEHCKEMCESHDADFRDDAKEDRERTESGAS